MANGALCVCHELEVPVDLYPGPAKHSESATAMPPPRQRHPLPKGGSSLTAKSVAAPADQMLATAMPESPLAVDIFLDVVSLLLPTRSSLSVTVGDLGLPQGALKPNHQQDDPDAPRKFVNNMEFYTVIMTFWYSLQVISLNYVQ